MSDSTANINDPAPDLEQIIEIRNPAVDVSKVMAEIRETLRQHGPFQQPDVPPFGVMAEEGEGALAYYLSQANLYYDQVWVEVNVIRPSIPFVGGLVMRAKTLLHELAVYYVNLHAGKQINVNASLVRALNALAKSRESGSSDHGELDALRNEIVDLKARIAELESQL